MKQQFAPVAVGIFRFQQIENTFCMYCGGAVARALAPGTNVNNLLQIARTASQAGNSEEAFLYFTKVLECDLTNTEAWLGKAEAAGWRSTLGNLRLREAESYVAKALQTITDESVRKTVREHGAAILNRIATATHSMAREHLLEYVALDDTWDEYLERCAAIVSVLEYAHNLVPTNVTYINNILQVYIDNVEGVEYFDRYNSDAMGTKTRSLSPEYEQVLRELIRIYSERRQALSPSYTAPEIRKATSSACFVATAVYGDPNHSSVRILRTFRDTILVTTVFGRQAIRFYYVIGPAAARIVGGNRTVRTLLRILLIEPITYVASVIVRGRTK